MKQKKTIKARDVVNDIRARMTDADLMEKYDLSARGLESLFKKLLDAKAVKRSELYGRFPTKDDTVNLGNLRSAPRNYLAFALPLYDSTDQRNLGVVRDITEKGIQVAGIDTSVDETREFLIKADDFEDIEPFSFKAKCRWTNGTNGAAEPTAGFEIVDIEDGALKQLREVIITLAFSEEQA